MMIMQHAINIITVQLQNSKFACVEIVKRTNREKNSDIEKSKFDCEFNSFT